MNAMVVPAAPSPAISKDERARRAYAVSFGGGSTYLSGGTLTDEAQAINARFVAGELTQAEWIAAMLAFDTARFGE